MLDEIKVCVEARTNFFGTYMTVPEQLQAELDDFISRICALGESCSSAGEFEQKFASSGLSDTFNSLVSRCTPQAHQMTRDEKAHARETAKEIFREDRGRILKEAGNDLLETVSMKAESDLRSASIKKMAEEGVLDDYTKVSNAIDDIGIIGRFFKRKFGKKD